MTQPTALRLAVLGSFRGGLTLGEVQEAEDELNRLVAQRDALLEALKTVEWHGQGSCWVVDADKIAAAIKKAEENT
jgi:hypothetical protein